MSDVGKGGQDPRNLSLDQLGKRVHLDPDVDPVGTGNPPEHAPDRLTSFQRGDHWMDAHGPTRRLGDQQAGLLCPRPDELVPIRAEDLEGGFVTVDQNAVQVVHEKSARQRAPVEARGQRLRIIVSAAGHLLSE